VPDAAHDSPANGPVAIARRDGPGPWRALGWPAGWAPVIVFAVGMLALRVVFMAGFDPFTLIEDEAHYWEWSRRLGLSYYSKGPGVAWVIALATGLFGDTEWAVRLPAMIASSVGSIAVAGLARDAFGDRRLMIGAAVAYQTMPGVFATGLLMTIDGPYVACWALAAWMGWRALAHPRDRWTGPAWIGLGLALAVGLLFKYTILLLPLGLGLFAVLRRGHLKRADGGWVLGGLACALLGALPIAVWNAQHDWATVRHLLGHLGVAGGDMPARQGGDAGWSYDPMWTLEFLGLQFGVAGATLALAGLGVINMLRAKHVGRREWREAAPAFLLCCSIPLLVFYAMVTLVTQVEANWTMAAYATLAPVGAWAAADGIRRHDRPMRFVWHLCLSILVVMIVGTPVLAWFVRTEMAPASMGRIKPIEPYIDEVLAVAAEVEAETGEPPVFIAIHYGRASQLAFYLPGHPTVYAASAHFGDGRRTQYDVWAETDLANPAVGDRLRGRAAVMFDGSASEWRRLFERVEDLGMLEHEPKRGRPTLKGFGFTGVPDERARNANGETE
jgi:4-amino-4-deoxy-L-arabinose transferase-like glycosyltransferase